MAPAHRLRLRRPLAAPSAEPLNNIARTTIETMAVACAGLQSVFTAAYDEAFAIPTELSARTALRVQQIVAYETDVAKTVDPLAGSYFVEALTDDMERASPTIMDELEAQAAWCAASKRASCSDASPSAPTSISATSTRAGCRWSASTSSRRRRRRPIQIHRGDEAGERAKAEAVKQLRAARDNAATTRDARGAGGGGARHATT